MNPRLALTLFVLTAMARSVTADYVTWNVVDLKGDPYSKTVVRFTPIRGWVADGTNTIVDVVRSATPSATGGGRTKVLGGVYKVTADGAPGSTLIAVPGDGGEYTLNQCAQFATNCPPFFFTNFFGRISERVKVSGEGVAIVTNNPGAWNEYISLVVTSSGGPTNGITAATATNIAASIAADTNAALLSAINTASNAAVATAKTNAGQRIYNVQSYGAVGDGVTDDSAAIRAAWFALTNYGAGVLYFPAGRYPDTNSYDLNTDVYTKTPQGYKLNTFEIAGDGEAASVWLAKITNAAFITMSSAVINMHHLTIQNAGSGVNTGVRAKVTGTVSMRNVTFSKFTTTGSIGADFPLTCGGLIDRCEFNFCHIGLRLPSYADGWEVFATIHYNTVGIMVGGSYAFDDGLSTLRANAVNINATGHGNGWPVVIAMQSNATKVSGYYEDSTNCVVSIGMPPDFAAERAKETYVGPVQVSDLAGVDTRVPESPAVKVYATNALSLIMRNVMKGDVAVEFANSYAETNMMIDIEGCRSPVIKLASGKTPKLANVAYNNGAARRVTWNLQEEHFSFRDVTNAYHAALPWGRLRVGERITAKSFSADGIQQAMLYMFTPGASTARLLYGGGSSETKPVSQHDFYVGTPSAAGAGSIALTISPTGLFGNGYGLTNIPLTGVAGLPAALAWLTNNTGSSTGAVSSVNGLTGAVTLDASAVGAEPVLGFAPQYGTANVTNWAQISTNIIGDLRQEIADTTLDFVPQYGTENGTNWAAVDPADWRESKATKTLVVDAENGSDVTGARGRLDKPYASLVAASSASAPGDVILIRPGSNYVSSSVWLKTNVTVRGYGVASKIYGDAAQTNQAVLAVTNSGVTIEDVWVSAAGTAIGYIGGPGNLAYATNVTLRNVHADGGLYGVAWDGDYLDTGEDHSVTVLMESCAVYGAGVIGVRFHGHTNIASVRMNNCSVTGNIDAVILGGCVAVIEGGRYIATQIDGITTGNYADVTVRNAYVRGGPSANFDLFNDGYPTAVLREDGVDYRTPEVGGDGWDRINHVPRQGVQAGEVRTGSLVVSNGISAGEVRTGSLVVSNGINATNLTGTIDAARLPAATTNAIWGGINLSNPAVNAIYMLSITTNTTLVNFGNMHASEFRTAQLWVTNGAGSNCTVALPGGTRCPDGNPLYCTNGGVRVISIGGLINFTNAISRWLP